MSDYQPADIISELKKCATNFVYFCKKYATVEHPLRGYIPFELHPYQEKLAESFNKDRFVIVNKYRWGGFSSLLNAYALWKCLFDLDQRILFQYKTDREAINIGGRAVRRMINCLPDWMKPKLDGKCNDHTIDFTDTGSNISFYTCEASCGKSATHLIYEEAAFIKDMEAHWKCSYPIISTGGKAFVVSTPNGNTPRKDNWFRAVCEDSQKGLNAFVYHKIDCTNDPKYNDEWVAELKKNLGEKGFQYEMMCSFGEEEEKKEEPKEELPKFKGKFQEAKPFSKGRLYSWNQEKVEPEEFLFKKQFSEYQKPSDSVNKRYDEKVFHVYDVENKQIILTGDCPPKKDQVFGDIDLEMMPDLKTASAQPLDVENPVVKEVLEDMALLSGVEKPKEDDGDFEKEVLDDWFTGEQVAKVWEDIAEGMPEYSEAKLYAKDCKKKHRAWSGLLSKDEWVVPDLLTLAGVEAGTDKEEEPEDYRALLLSVLVKDMPENMQLDFDEDALCVNGVPTKISTKSIEMAFEGLVELTGTKDSLTTVGSIIKRKLQLLF